MKKKADSELDDWPRDEYDFSQMGEGVRGKHAERFKKGTNLILLEPDVAEAFPTSQAVNSALRIVMRLARTIKATKKPAGKH